MEALFASCPEEFQSPRSSRTQEIAIVGGLKAEIISLRQQWQNHDLRINTLDCCEHPHEGGERRARHLQSSTARRSGRSTSPGRTGS
eukprot:5796191-Alexandrium_andersonii.AAC.1